jgi:hypothetical protein
MTGRWFADICSGAGGVAKAVRSRGFRSAEWDTLFGSAYDVGLRKNQRTIAADVKAGRIFGMMLAPPCSSFSLARTRNSVIRTKENPWGISGLDERLQKQVEDGNRVMRACIHLFTTCQQKGVPAAFEQPSTSYALHTPEMLAIVELPNVVSLLVDFCAYGTRWRKRTRLILCNVDADDIERLRRRRCTGTDGVCCFTGMRHFELAGRNAQNVLWTQIAQPYPNKLNADLAFVLTDCERARQCT